MENYAVRFGEAADLGMKGNQVAWPFMYTFVGRNDDRWDQVKNPTTMDDLQDLGPVIPNGGRAFVNVTLDPDFMFKLIYVQYSVYKLIQPEGMPYFAWHDPQAGLWVDPVLLEASSHARIDRNVRVNVEFLPQDRFIYGQTNPFEQTQNQRSPQPLCIFGLQGYEYGPSYCRTPVLLPHSGQLRFEIYNDNRVDVVVAAKIYGMKVRL